MAGSADLVNLQRLAMLCEAQHRLAQQAEAEALREASAAERRRAQSETAVNQAQQDWRRAMDTTDLGPDLASALGDRLVGCAASLGAAVDQENEACRLLAEREEARQVAQANVQQTEEVVSGYLRKLRRKRDERALARIEDRIAYQERLA